MAVFVLVLAGIYIALVDFLCWALNEKSWIWENYLSRRFRKAPLIIIPRGRGDIGVRPSTFLALELIDARGLSSSRLFPRGVILIWRLMAVCFWVGSFFEMSSNGGLQHTYMIFYTLWTFTLFCLTNLIGIAVIARDMMIYSVETESSWGRLQTLHQILFTIVAPASLFLMLFYWLVLHSGDTSPIENSLFVHGFNNVFLLFEACFTNVAIVSSHFLFLMIYSTIYALFMVIYHSLGGNWPYPVLSDSPSSIPYYIALPVLLAGAFFFYVGLVYVRERLRGRSEYALLPSSM